MKRNLFRSLQVILMAFALMLVMVGQPAMAADNPLTPGCKISLQADSGQWFSRCAGCQKTVNNLRDTVTTHVNSPPRGPAVFEVVDAGGGKIALKADTGKYVARCKGCIKDGKVRDFLTIHVTDPSVGPAQFTPELLSNGKYTLKADTGKYVARCQGCSPGATVDPVTVHVTDPNVAAAQWNIVSDCPESPETINPCDPNTPISTNTISFEKTPNGAIPQDNLALTGSYEDQGTVVTFGFDTNKDLTIDKKAVLESRQPGTGGAYTSKGIPDIDRTSNKQGGNWLLRAPNGFNVFNDVPNTTQADFLVVYSGTPVQSASGQLWDIDAGEQYKIEALDADGKVITSLLTPGNIPAGEGDGTYDGLPYNFSFPDKGQDIGYIRISGVKRITGGGFAFDNFNATAAQVCEPSNPCDPNKPIPGAFSTIRIGDFDGFGFKEGTGLKSATGDAINVDGKGILSTKDFLPDFNGDKLISNRGEGDPFDNRSDAEVTGTYLTGDGFEDMGSQGSDYTDLSLGKVFAYETSPTYGHSFPDGDPNTLPNTPGFKFHFKVAKDKLPEGTPLFFNVIFGDYDVEPVGIIFTNSQGETVTRELTASAQGKNDGLISSAFATLDFSDVFTDGDTSGETGYWLGYLDVDFEAPAEPYLSFDFAEIGTKQIPLTPCSGGTTPVEGNIVNIDSTKNLSPETATKLTLPAGTYTLHVIGQADGGNYDAWTRTELIDGCDGNGENCTKGWEHKYFYQLGNTDSVKVDRTDRYSTASAALANPPADVTFTLPQETEVDFYVVDGGDPSNNRGGVSLQIISQS